MITDNNLQVRLAEISGQFAENVTVQDITGNSVTVVDGEVINYSKLYLISGVIGNRDWARAIYTDGIVREYLDQYNLESVFSIDEKSNQTTIYIVEKETNESLSTEDNINQEVTDV